MRKNFYEERGEMKKYDKNFSRCFKNQNVKNSKVSLKKILATNYELLCNILDKKNRELKKMRLKNIFILYLRLKIISLKSL